MIDFIFYLAFYKSEILLLFLDLNFIKLWLKGNKFGDLFDTVPSLYRTHPSQIFSKFFDAQGPKPLNHHWHPNLSLSIDFPKLLIPLNRPSQTPSLSIINLHIISSITTFLSFFSPLCFDFTREKMFACHCLGKISTFFSYSFIFFQYFSLTL